MMPRVRGQRHAERPDWTRTYAPRTLSEVLGKCHTPDGLARTQGAKSVTSDGLRIRCFCCSNPCPLKHITTASTRKRHGRRDLLGDARAVVWPWARAEAC